MQDGGGSAGSPEVPLTPSWHDVVLPCVDGETVHLVVRSDSSVTVAGAAGRVPTSQSSRTD